MSKQKPLFAAVWSDYPLDGKTSGPCDEWVEVFETFYEAVQTCGEWVEGERGPNVRIFVAEALNRDGEYSTELVRY